MDITEIWVNRDNYRETKIVTQPVSPLLDGEILVAIDKYALTANNGTYAVSGDMIGYWKYFPTGEEAWGKVPVWGLADVVESNCDEVKVGQRIYGFFPMASHLKMTPGKIRPGNFTDTTDHRSPLPPLYNQYMRTDSEPPSLREVEDERCIYFPLFVTGYVIVDLLEDHRFHEADQILIGSVSSKTGFGLAHFLKTNEKFTGRIVGLTSAGNKGFVEDLGLCDQVVSYGHEDQVDSGLRTVYVDMSGNGPLRRNLHQRLGDNMVASYLVGATHWEAERTPKDLPGARPVFFFAPGQIAKRDEEWGRGTLLKKAYGACAELAIQLQGRLTIEHVQGAEAGVRLWRDMLDNKVPGSRGMMVSL